MDDSRAREAAAEIQVLLKQSQELERELVRVRHRIGAILLCLAQSPRPRGSRSLVQTCAVLLKVSRHWLERHARAHAAVVVGGIDRIESLVNRLTLKDEVLSPTQYIQHGMQRPGAARRDWRIRVFGLDPLGSTSREPPAAKTPAPTETSPNTLAPSVEQ